MYKKTDFNESSRNDTKMKKSNIKKIKKLKKIKSSDHQIEVIDLSHDNVAKIHPAMREFIGYCIYKLAIRFRAQTDAGFSSYRLVAPQSGILNLLYNVGTMTQIELGGYLAIDKATMVRFIDDLENKKYLVRTTCQQDRRAKILCLTDLGRKTVEKLQKIRRKVENQMLSPLSESEKKQFRALISKLTIQEHL